ncbi:hypothetical protein K440DRAFT_643408 [Wilcoxina mikolae CBS 423.85]|nr:hypothetical protein K440DRAFT_643408 [Wilcoxina mikolae CBS 423.85]
MSRPLKYRSFPAAAGCQPVVDHSSSQPKDQSYIPTSISSRLITDETLKATGKDRASQNQSRPPSFESKGLTATGEGAGSASSEPDRKNHADRPQLRGCDPEASLTEKLQHEAYKQPQVFWRKQLILHESENEKLQNTITNLQRTMEEERTQFESTIEGLRSENTDLKRKVNTLGTTYIQAVESVGTGLEPISYHTFKYRFRTLHDKVQYVCRKLFKPRGHICAAEDLAKDLKEMVLTRAYAYDQLRFSYPLQLIIFAFIEKHIFSVWFTGLPEETANQMAKLHSWMRACMPIPPSNTRQPAIPGNPSAPEIVEYWRAYTKSLLFQHPRVGEFIQDVSLLSSQLLSQLLAVQDGQITVVQERFEELKEVLVDAKILAAELGCQRGFYQLDDEISVGDKYDDSRMMDAMCGMDVDEDVEGVVVSCILSKGWVKRAYMRANNGETICKAMVLVRQDSGSEREVEMIAI